MPATSIAPAAAVRRAPASEDVSRPAQPALRAASAEGFSEQGLELRRLRVDAVLRLAVALTVAAGAAIAHWGLGIAALDVRALLSLAAAIGVCDLGVLYCIRRHAVRGGFPSLSLVRNTSIALDHLGLAVLIYLAGGARSPLVAVFLLHLVLNSLTMSRREAYAHALTAYALLATLVAGEWWGVLRPDPRVAALWSGGAGGVGAVGTLGAFAVLFALLSVLLTRLAELVRGEQGKVEAANSELARVSQSRRDILHVALHNLKSPVSAVSMMLTNLEAGMDGPVSERQRDRLRRCLLRLRQSSAFLRDLHVLALLDAQELGQQAGPTDVGAILSEIFEEYHDTADERRHSLTIDLPVGLPPVHGIKRLLREAVANLVTNAIKYTPQGGHIVVRALAEPDEVRIEVQDDGVGIATEDLERLFSEFHPLKPRDAKVADGLGTGLGLSIVRRIAEAHGGHVEVTSRPGAGATFAMSVPRERETPVSASGGSLAPPPAD